MEDFTETAALDPWARAVIRDGTIHLNQWTPNLMWGGPQRAILLPLAQRGVVLADLASDWDDDGLEDLRVEWVPAGGGSEEAAETLLAWAEQVGYRRVWLPDRVVELGDRLFEGGLAAVDCPTCGLRWEDESGDFWAMVRTNGHFPGSCQACNGSLPEWRVARAAARRAAARDHRRASAEGVAP